MASITVDAADLRAAEAWARPDPKHLIPAVGHVRAIITGGRLNLACFDWETCWMGHAAGTGWDNQTATALIPAAHLKAAVASQPRKGPVEVTVDDDAGIDLVAKGHRLTVVQVCDPAECPALPDPPRPAGWAPGNLFGPAAFAVSGCVSGEKQKPMLQAVRFAPGQSILGLEASSQYVAGRHQVPFTRLDGTPVPDGPEEFLIPGRLVARFTALCGPGPVFAGWPDQAGGWALLSDGTRTLVTKTIHGTWPDLTAVIARQAKPVCWFTVHTGHLDEILVQAAAQLNTHADGYLAQVLDDPADERRPTEKRAAVGRLRGTGMWVQAAPNHSGLLAVEVFAVHPFTGAELGRWPVPVTGPKGDPVLCSVNPELLRLLLPASGDVVVGVPADPEAAVRVNWPGTARWESVIMPVKSIQPVKEEVNA